MSLVPWLYSIRAVSAPQLRFSSCPPPSCSKLMRVHATVAGRHTRHGQLLPPECYLEEGIPLVRRCLACRVAHASSARIKTPPCMPQAAPRPPLCTRTKTASCCLAAFACATVAVSLTSDIPARLPSPR